MIRIDPFAHQFNACLCGHHVHIGKPIVRATTVDVRVTCPPCATQLGTLPAGRTIIFVSPKMGEQLSKGTAVSFAKGQARVVSAKPMRQFPGKRSAIKAYAVVLEYLPT